MKRLLLIGRWRPWRAALCAVCLAASLVAYADDSAQVTITQVDSLGNTLADETYGSTEASFVSVTAPARSGYRFTHWSVAPADTPNFVNRDAWGRALDRVSVVPKGDTTLMAHYADATADSDGDGIPDADEVYWYGDLDEGTDSDTDGDGYTFKQELQYGMNPLFPNTLVLGGINYGDSDTFWYNPFGYTPYTIQANTDGTIAVVEVSYLAPGESKTTGTYSAEDGFAYWTLNGVPQTDVFGRARDAITFVGTGEATGDGIVAEAVLLTDADARAIAYWYGINTDKTMASDTDGDGYTLAQELQYGMNPHFPNELVLGGVNYGDSETFWYNPNQYSPYLIQTDTNGVLAEVESGFLKIGQSKTTTSYAGNNAFHYWTLNGTRQADVFGRAYDQVTLVGTGSPDESQVATAILRTEATADERAIAYWYGPDSGITADSDTDGDGYTLAQEVQYGMSPHFRNELVLGGVNYGDGPTLETNLQPFDMGAKAVIDGKVVDFFATVDTLTGSLSGGLDFSGAVVTPAIVDADSDGNFDLVVATPTAITLYKNIGAAGAPNFTVFENVYPRLQAQMATMVRLTLVGGTITVDDTTHPALWLADQGGAVYCYDITADTLTATETTGFPVWQTAFGTFADGTLTLADATTISCDAIPAGVTSVAYADANQDDIHDLLVADDQGRISLYTQDSGAFTLRHRVWGGSYVGFANGLALAPVDWDDDGDLDAVCGTSDGHLLLLTDPGIGRPSNLMATAGYDNVLLQWEPNGQSRVYGYGVYRADSAATDFASIAEANLPTYRDEPPAIAEWAYRVTAKSRLWKAGNSTPEVFESAPSETVSVNLGQVTFALPDAAGFYGQTVDAVLSIDNSKGLGAEGLSLTVTYDAALLTPAGYQLSGLSQGLTVSDTAVVDPETNLGTRTIAATAGTLAPGSGELIRLHFAVSSGSTPITTPVTLTAATVRSLKGQQVTTVLPETAAHFTLDEQVEPIVVELAGTNVVAETWPVSITVDVLVDDEAFDWDSLVLTPTYDTSLLSLASSTVPTAENPSATFTFNKVDGAEDPESGFAEVIVSGTATHAEMDPVTCAILLPVDDDPRPGKWWRPVVILSADHRGHKRLIRPDVNGTITVTLDIFAIGWFDWDSLEVIPTFDPKELTLVATSALQRESYWKRTLVYTFTVSPEVENRHVEIHFDATGVSRLSSDIEAIVLDTKTKLHIAERPHPGVVQPWTSGDCTGDGRLTAADYEVAMTLVRKYFLGAHTALFTPSEKQVYRSISQAIGKSADGWFTPTYITNLYKKYLMERGVKLDKTHYNGGKK